MPFIKTWFIQLLKLSQLSGDCSYKTNQHLYLKRVWEYPIVPTARQIPGAGPLTQTPITHLGTDS